MTSFKDSMKSGRPAAGCWLSLFSPMAAEIVAQAGYDCVMIDLEHGPGSTLDAIALMQAIQGRECAALLRVPENAPVWLKKVLDAGVGGVMVPSVNSAAEAEAVVQACRYAPRGTFAAWRRRWCGPRTTVPIGKPTWSGLSGNCW